MLSRSALTDPLFTLFFVLALAAIVRVLERPGSRWIWVAGLLTGAAWNTKYHGWFVGLIGLGAIGWIWWHERRDGGGQHLVSRVLRLLAVGAIGFATYLPWATYMRAASGSRGFAGIVEYYLALIGTGWIANATRHAEMQLYLDGTLARAGIALTVGTALAVAAPLRANRVLMILVGSVLAVSIGGGLGAVLLLALLGLVALLTDRSRAAAGVLLAWVGLWVVAAPLYHPYARLLLPVIPALALVAGRGVVALVRWAEAPVAARGVPQRVALAIGGALVLLTMVTPSLVRGVGNPWRDTTGSRIAAARMALVTPIDAPIYVIGEPSLSYYLRREGRTVTDVVDGLDLLDTLSTPALLVAGVYARRAPPLREGLHRIAARLDSLERYPAAPNDLRLLDDMTPDRARRFLVTPDTTFDMVLFRVRRSVAPADPSGGLD
jgi:4-amino-4-deoxy-L-arabinose transferase-like glycosyltransferase